MEAMRLEPFEQKTQEYNSLLRIAEVYSYDDEFTEEELRRIELSHQQAK